MKQKLRKIDMVLVSEFIVYFMYTFTSPIAMKTINSAIPEQLIALQTMMGSISRILITAAINSEGFDTSVMIGLTMTTNRELSQTQQH